MKLTFETSWDFPDYKGWEISLGKHIEGQITWRSKDNEDVKKDGFRIGYVVLGCGDNPSIEEPFETFDEALDAFAKLLQEPQ
jgi:hypothetical protein